MLTLVAVLLAQVAQPVETEQQAFESILSLEAAARTGSYFRALGEPPFNQLNNKQELPDQPRAVVEACARFVSSWPQSARRSEVLFLAARIQFDHNHLDEALPVLTELAFTSPEVRVQRPASDESSLCALAVYLVLGAWQLLDDHEKLNIGARKFAVSRCAARNRNLTKELREQEVHSTFFLARDHKEPMLRADAFVHFAADFPDSSAAEQALLHASSDYRKAGLTEKANATCKQFLARYPKSQFAAQVRQALADATKALPTH